MAGVVGCQDEWPIDGPKSAQTLAGPTKLEGPLKQHETTLGDRTRAFDKGMVESSLDVFGGGMGLRVGHFKYCKDVGTNRPSTNGLSKTLSGPVVG